MYTIKNTEKNNEKASDYETFSLLYLLGVRSDKNDIDLVLIDCFNDVTGTDENVSRLWDVQSKGHKSNTPLKVGEHLVTLYANYLSEFPFSFLILFLEIVDSIHVIDDNIVNLARVSQNLVEMVDQVALDLFFHGVEQGDLLVLYQIGVVAGALVRGVAVEIADVPVHGANPVDVLFDLYRSHVVLMCKTPADYFRPTGV